jgi:transketolase
MCSFCQGGIGEAVLDAISENRDLILRKMCVREVPRSGPPMVLLEKYGIGTDCIVQQVLNFKDL